METSKPGFLAHYENCGNCGNYRLTTMAQMTLMTSGLQNR